MTFLSLLGLHQACVGEGVGWTLSQGLCVLSRGSLPRFCAPRVDGGRENRVADSTFPGGDPLCPNPLSLKGILRALALGMATC